MASLALAFDITARDQASPVLRRVGDEADRTGKRVQGFGGTVSRGMDTATKAVSGFGSTLTAAVGVLAGAGIVRGLGAVVTAASNAEQSIGGTQAVFKSYADSVIADSGRADRALGLSANSYRELATVIGSQLKNARVPMEDLAGQTEKIIQIGADLAAQFGGSTQDAVQALSATFRGETDPIERYGISLTAASVGAKAVELGLAQSATKLDQNAKLMATLAIVTEQSADAQGAFAREADTAAGRVARASAQWENLKVQIGDKLLPVWSGLMDFVGKTVIPALGSVVDAVSGLISWFADLPGPVKVAVVALAGVAALKGPVSAALDAIATKVANMALSMASSVGQVGALRAAGSGLLSFFGGPWGLAIAGATVGLSLLVDWLGRSDNATTDLAAAQGTLTDAIKATNGALDESVRRAAAEALQREHLLELADLYGFKSQDLVGYVLGESDAHDRVTTSLQRYREELEAKLTGDKDADIVTRGLIGALDEQIGALDALAGSTESTVGKERQLAQATGQTGAAMEASTEQTEEAKKALEDWLKQLQGINAGFVEPLSVYQGLLADKKQAEQESAQATADATESGKDSWEDYVGDVSLSLDEYAAKLQEQITAQENWRANLVTVAGRGGVELAQILSGMGEDGAVIVQQMVDANAEDFARMRDLMIRDARLGGEGATAELDNALKVMAVVGSDGASRTVAGIAHQLGIGVDEVARIAAQYGIKLADGVNPLLAALGQRTVSIITRGSQANSGSLDRPGFALGGYTGDGGKFEPKGVVHGGEFVFTKEQTRKAGVRNLEVYAKILEGYAGGGFVSESSVPLPPSLAPYGPPISTAGDAAMDTAYRATTNFVRENGPWGRGLAWAKTQVGKPYIWGGVGPEGYDCSGFMSAITNVILGLPPYSRRGSTATFPWPGFASGFGEFTIGSVGNAGNGIGHMAGTVLGVNVESAGGVGVRVGGSARGAADGLFSERAHLAFDQGGLLPPGMTLAYNGTGKPETVRTAEQEAALHRPMELSDRTIDRLAAAMVRGAGAAISYGNYRQGLNVRSS